VTEERDVVVVGSGAGGAAVAATLAGRGKRVLLVEKGGPAAPLPDAMDAVYRYYAHGGLSASVGNCLLPIPTGTVLGGTTQINSGTCLKTPDETLERWERAGTGAFRADEFRRYLDLAWTKLRVTSAPDATATVSSRLFLKGLERLGVPGGHLLPRAESGCVGSGRCCFVCPTGAKQTSDRAFLLPLGRPDGPELALGTELIDARAADRAGGPVRVALRGPDGRRRNVSCGRLVLACGTLRTPYYARLLKTGLGRAAGAGLSVHPAAKLFALFDERVEGWKGVPQGAGVVDPDDPNIRYEGVYTPPEMAAVTMPLEGLRLRSWLKNYGRVATFGWMIRDESRGRADYPLGADSPLLRYDLGDADLARMRRAMRFAGRTFFAAGARQVVLPFNRSDNVFDSAEALERADLSGLSAAQLQMMAFHPLGTCGMGRVVDENLRLAEGVYVCDGSVIPESLGVNPQITIYAFALRLADHLS